MCWVRSEFRKSDRCKFLECLRICCFCKRCVHRVVFWEEFHKCAIWKTKSFNDKSNRLSKRAMMTTNPFICFSILTLSKPCWTLLMASSPAFTRNVSPIVPTVSSVLQQRITSFHMERTTNMTLDINAIKSDRKNMIVYDIGWKLIVTSLLIVLLDVNPDRRQVLDQEQYPDSFHISTSLHKWWSIQNSV